MHHRLLLASLGGLVLTLRLEARSGMWYPEGPGGAGIEVAAWAEVGQPLLNPGPLIRVPAGTTVKASLRNTLTKFDHELGETSA